MQATIASQFAPVAARANATSSRAQRVPGVCRIRAVAPATRVAAPVAGASSLAIGSTFAADRALNVAVARQVTLKPQPARGVVRCNAGRRRRRKVRRNNFREGKGTVRRAGIASRARAFGTRRARVRFPSPPMRDRYDDRAVPGRGYQPRRCSPLRPSPSRPLSTINPFPFPRPCPTGGFPFVRCTDARHAPFSPRRERNRSAPSGIFANNPALETVMYFALWYFLNVQFNIVNKQIYNYFPFPWFVSRSTSPSACSS